VLVIKYIIIFPCIARMSLNKVGKGFYISKSPAICKGGFSFILLLLSKPLLNRERKKKQRTGEKQGS
jgi:hypothetical protein